MSTFGRRPARGEVPRRVGRLVASLCCAAIAAVFPAAPAAAHSDNQPVAGDYVTKLTSVTPAMEGLKLRVVRNGTRLELRNNTRATLEVLGYSGEPYLRISPHGSYANTRSPSVYVNDDLGARQPPDHVEVGATATPAWERIKDGSVLLWHDHRTHWMSEKPPPVAAREPGKRHRIFTWDIKFRVLDNAGTKPIVTNSGAGGTNGQAGARVITATGTLDYVPPPAAGVWWAGIIAATGAVVALSLLIAPGQDRNSGQDREKQWTFRGNLFLATLLSLAAVADLTNSVGYALDSGAVGLHIVTALFTAQTYGTLTALAALTAAVMAIRNHPAALLALGLAGACLAVLGGITDTAIFSHGRAALPWSPQLARICTTATLALASGVAISCWVRIRAERTQNTEVAQNLA